jgi:hypothetical protein
VEGEVGEAGQLKEMLAGWGLVDDLVLEDPGKVVRNEDGVEAGAEGRVDVRPRAVADHPGGAGLAAVVGGQGQVGFVVFFGENLDGGEVVGEAGTLELTGLFLGVAFGDHDETVAGSEVGEGGGDAGEQLDLVIGDGLSEAGDALVLFGGDGGVGELLKAGDQGLAEAVEAIAMGADGGVFDAVEVLADLFGGVDAVIQVGDEAGDGLLEVDVVLPEGVVGVEEQSLGGCGTGWRGIERHRLII